MSGLRWGNVGGMGGRDIEWWGSRRRGDRVYELTAGRRALYHKSQQANHLDMNH